jgi:CheY-like chemotaxis protein
MRWTGARGRPGLGRIFGRGQRPAPARVLVADDDAAIRQLIAVYLTAAGFTVVLAGSGTAALELAASGQPRVAVLDAGMPPPAGWEVARQLRADPATAGIRTVLLWPDEGGQGGLAGADAGLAKPFSPAELVTLVRGFAGADPAVTTRAVSRWGHRRRS